MGSERKTTFRFSSENDIALLMEVESNNPYSFGKPKLVWEEISKKLNEKYTKMNVTGRSCRNRVELLLKQFKADEMSSKKASGVTEEEMSQLVHLLTSINKLAEDRDPQLHKLYTKTNREKAENIRSQVLADMILITDDEDNTKNKENEDTATNGCAKTELLATDKQNGYVSIDATTNDDDSIPIKRQKTNSSRNETVTYLKEKMKMESIARKEELEIRRLEIENRKEELEIRKKELEAKSLLEAEKSRREERRIELEHDIRKQEIEANKQQSANFMSMLIDVLNAKK